MLVHLFYAPGGRSGSNFASLAAAEIFSGRKILLTAIEQTVKHIIRDYLDFWTRFVSPSEAAETVVLFSFSFTPSKYLLIISPVEGSADGYAQAEADWNAI